MLPSIGRLACVSLLLFGMTACSMVSPDAGKEAVLVQKPWFFGHGGVDSTPVTTGLTFVALSTESVDVDMQPIQRHIQFNDLMSLDGVPLDFDAVIRFQVTDSVQLVKKYRSVDSLYGNNIEREMSNAVREAVKKHGMNETAISTTALQQIDAEVSARIVEFVKTNDLPVVIKAFTVGRANPPDSIKHQRVETAAQQQRVLTEQQRTLAEQSRLQAEMARAKADNAYREAMELSPQQLLQLETIKMQREACAKGNCTFLIGTGATPVIPIK